MSKKTGELALFFSIWNERPHHCENTTCTNQISTFGEANFHHLLTKGAHPEKRLDEENIILLCGDCHRLAHQKGNSALDLDPEHQQLLEKYGALSCKHSKDPA